MPRYIKVEDAVKVADYGCGEFRGIFGRIKEQLEAIPTADVVPVVRCKDCKHYKQSEVDPSRKMCWRKDVDGWFVCYDFYPTDFCSYGERREDEEV